MSTVTSRDGTTIGFTRSGQGPAVILVDGAMCFRSFGPAQGLAAQLAPHFTVYIYDRRGRGESSDTEPYAVEREIEDIDALINEAGGSAYVYGISSGAALALQAACRLPAITRIATYEAPYAVDGTRPTTVENYTPRLKETLAAGRRGDAAELFMRNVGVSSEQEIAGMRQSPVWPVFESIAPTLLYDAYCIDNPADGSSLPPALIEQLGALKTPALVMAGGASPEWMLNTQRAIAKAIPGAQSRILEGQTHQVDAEAIAPALEAFFAG